MYDTALAFCTHLLEKCLVISTEYVFAIAVTNFPHCLPDFAATLASMVCFAHISMWSGNTSFRAGLRTWSTSFLCWLLKSLGRIWLGTLDSTVLWFLSTSSDPRSSLLSWSWLDQCGWHPTNDAMQSNMPLYTLQRWAMSREITGRIVFRTSFASNWKEERKINNVASTASCTTNKGQRITLPHFAKYGKINWKFVMPAFFWQSALLLIAPCCTPCCLRYLLCPLAPEDPLSLEVPSSPLLQLFLDNVSLADCRPQHNWTTHSSVFQVHSNRVSSGHFFQDKFS